MASVIPTLHAPPGLVRWWAAKSRGERRIVAAIAALALAAVGWLAIWQPLQRDLASLQSSVPAQRRALASAQRMADEIAGLARAPAPTGATDARAELERVLSQHGLRGLVTQMDWQEGRARVVFAAIGFDSLVPALEALQRETGLRIIEATLTARVEPGSVRAEIVLAR
jgi:type II secretory pathway component PulM